MVAPVRWGVGRELFRWGLRVSFECSSTVTLAAESKILPAKEVLTYAA